VVGIDAAMTANHRVVVRRPEAGGPGVVIDDFEPAPPSGLERLSKGLSAYPSRRPPAPAGHLDLLRESWEGAITD